MAICFFTLTVSLALAQQATTERPSSQTAGPADPVAYLSDNLTSLSSAPGVIEKQTVEVVKAPFSPSDPPATMTVRTEALLQLHAMRKSAVDLCLQLPRKYRTRLPQCAAIFQDEIRLQELAKDKPSAP
jgi:hypothetical protein